MSSHTHTHLPLPQSIEAENLANKLSKMKSSSHKAQKTAVKRQEAVAKTTKKLADKYGKHDLHGDEDFDEDKLVQLLNEDDSEVLADYQEETWSQEDM